MPIFETQEPNIHGSWHLPYDVELGNTCNVNGRSIVILNPNDFEMSVTYRIKKIIPGQLKQYTFHNLVLPPKINGPVTIGCTRDANALYEAWLEWAYPGVGYFPRNLLNAPDALVIVRERNGTRMVQNQHFYRRIWISVQKANGSRFNIHLSPLNVFDTPNDQPPVWRIGRDDVVDYANYSMFEKQIDEPEVLDLL